MSEASNINLAPEFRKHPERAKWLVEKILPAMKQHFEDFDINVVISALTDDSMDIKRIKSLFSSHQRKQQKFQAEGIKKPRTAYFFFCDEKREELKAENESLSFGAVNQKLGDMWAGLSKADKKVYETKAEKDKSRYSKEYTSAKQSAIERGEFKENPMKNIKKPRTSYLCFSTDPAIRKKYGEKAEDNKQLMKVLGDVWKTMSDKQKKPYVDEAEKDKQRYNKEKSVLEKTMGKEVKASHQSQSESEPEDDDKHSNNNSENESSEENAEPVESSNKKSVKSSTKSSSKSSSKTKQSSKPVETKSESKSTKKPSKSGKSSDQKSSDVKKSSGKKQKKSQSSDDEEHADDGDE